MRENLLEIVLSDGECIAIESLLEPIYTCQNLVHKPKIIVLNVCRGSHNLGQGEILEAAQDRRGTRVHQLKVSVNLIFLVYENKKIYEESKLNCSIIGMINLRFV